MDESPRVIMNIDTNCVEVYAASPEDAKAIAAALREPDVLAFVKVVGYLKPLNLRAQHRIMKYLVDVFDERNPALAVQK